MTKNIKQVVIKKVRELPEYGLPIKGLTQAGRKRIFFDVWKVLRKHYNPFKVLFIILRGYYKGLKLRKMNPNAMETLKNWSVQSSREFPILGGLFLVVSEEYGDRSKTYQDIFKEIISLNAIDSMPDLYQVDKLAEMSDPFEAFKEFNYGLFKDEKFFPIDEFKDNGNHFSFKVTSCIQNNLSKEFGVPELGQVGCDHDCAGYPLIEDRVQAVFHRPCTLAKGGPYCDFNFYRKGSEPKKLSPNH